MDRSIGIVTAVLLAAALLAACGGTVERDDPSGSPDTTAVPTQLLEEARRATRAAASDFMGQLMQELKGNEPCYVGGVCPEFETAFNARMGIDLDEYEARFFEIIRAYLN